MLVHNSLLFVAGGLLVLILISLWTVLYQVVRQQGRLLLSVEALKARLDQSNSGRHLDVPSHPVGLAPGAAFTAFELLDLADNPVRLENYRGRRTLLVNWDAACGFCRRIAPDLARLQPDLKRKNLGLLLISHGGADANRRLAEEHGFEYPLLLDGKYLVPEFKGQPTPIAYLLDEHGRVSQPLVAGADQVLALARATLAEQEPARRLPGERPLSQSRIERNGLKAGTRAPAFDLPDIQGNTVSLETFHGRRVLLVFSDPGCGPCDQLTRQLAALGREHTRNDLTTIMVSRGDAGQNRHKAETHGVQFPVLLQRHWEVSRQYGIFDTPVAFLIDENGVITRAMARGPAQIMVLARETAAAPAPAELRA